MRKIKKHNFTRTKCPVCGSNKHFSKLEITLPFLIKSNYCQVCTYLKSQNKIKLKNDVDAYKYLTFNGKQNLIHRLVYETFHHIKLTPTDTIHHIDSNKSNNLPDNLLLTQHHNPELHKNHRRFKENALKNRIKELEVELEYYKKKHP